MHLRGFVVCALAGAAGGLVVYRIGHADGCRYWQHYLTSW